MTKIWKTKIVWRLKESPTSQALRELVKDKILSNEEAREILFSSESIEENKDNRDIESLKSEIKFLRELVDKLSQNNNTKIIEVIKEVEKPWKQYPWYEPYRWYCKSDTKIDYMDSKGIDTVGGTSYNLQGLAKDGTANFSNIKTF